MAIVVLTISKHLQADIALVSIVLWCNASTQLSAHNSRSIAYITSKNQIRDQRFQIGVLPNMNCGRDQIL